MRTRGHHGSDKRPTALAIGLIAGGLLLWPLLAASGQDAGSLAKEAGQELRESQKLMFNGQAEAAQSRLMKAAELIAAIKALDPKFSQLKSLEGKYAQQKKDLDKRLGTAPAGSGAASAEKPPGEGGAAKLPGGVTHRLKEVDQSLRKGESALAGDTAASDEWKIGVLEGVIAESQGLMDEIQKSYGAQAPADHPEIKARRDRIAEFQRQAQAFKEQAATKQEQANQTREAQNAQSQEWLAKINPYVTGMGQAGYDEGKYLIAGGTDDAAELNRRKKIYDEAAAVFAQYQKADFPAGKSDELLEAEKDLKYALDTFSAQYLSSVDRLFARADKRLAEAARWLTQEEAKDDGKRPPLLLQKDTLPDIKQLIDTAAAAAEDDPRIADLQNTLARLEKRAEDLRRLGMERTFITPDKFKGKEADAVKSKVAEVVRKEYPDAKVLRATVISEDWKEEDVVEYTDTTQTALRHRITRGVTAQAAAKRGPDVFLYTLSVSQDKLSDGTWGELRGHIMFTDPMPEKNVGK